jgi:hypothetical protein
MRWVLSLESSDSRRPGPPVGSGENAPMPIPTEFFRWWITDERTGKRRSTTYRMRRDEAAERFPDAEPDLDSREIRDLPAPGEDSPANSRPPP